MSIKETIKDLVSVLEIDESFLGTILGVSNLTLEKWKAGNEDNKIERLKTLQKIVYEIIRIRPLFNAKRILLVLQSGDIQYNKTESLPLINSILAYPDSQKNYKQTAKEAVENFEAYETANEKLKSIVSPCPFCGGKIYIRCVDAPDIPWNDVWQAQCEDDFCSVSGPIAQNADEARSKWNTINTRKPIQF